MLYPIENEIRQVKNLCGIWKFKKDNRFNQGFDEKWYEKPLSDFREMPVPSSYNDITVDKALRDHVGWVWYEKDFMIPKNWQNDRICLRFGSVTHHAVVFINGEEVMRHKGGFLPFECVINENLVCGKNRLTVAVSNMLDQDCIPFGFIKAADPKYYPQGEKKQVFAFDFFNYSGIHRPVKLYTTPKEYIKDINIKTDIVSNDGIIDYYILTEGISTNIKVSLYDEDGELVAQSDSLTDKFVIENPHLWNVRNAYLYELDICFGDDRYTLPVGIRTVKVTSKQILINGEPIYLKGFGKHEDSDIRGRGLDEALNVRDFELLKWIGANSFRTSHYPYSEEIMQMADRQGFLIIDEVPAVGMNFWSKDPIFREGGVDGKTLEHHKEQLTELYERDKNHPCVIMWSVANEPSTKDSEALPYFEEVVRHIRSLDNTRPITYVIDEKIDADKASHLFDVICLNRYYSWYYDQFDLGVIYDRLKTEFEAWHNKYNKPIMITEYGTDAIAGLHKLPEVIFSEEYQIEFYKENNRALDECDFVIGEHLWAFADFMTSFGLKRFDGNKKGIFTRQRQPKSVAFYIKERWNNKK